jgi:hypothetical protein
MLLKVIATVVFYLMINQIINLYVIGETSEIHIVFDFLIFTGCFGVVDVIYRFVSKYSDN